MIDPATISKGTRIWRPVHVCRANVPQASIYAYKALPVRFTPAKHQSQLCRTVDFHGMSLPGALIAADFSASGLCVFVNGDLPTQWTYLTVVKSLKTALVAKAEVGNIHDLYNVFCDLNRRARIDKLGSPDPDLLPRHTDNYIFKGDRVLVPKSLTGEGKRDEDNTGFVHKQTGGFTGIVADIPGPKTVFVSWYSEGIEFSAPVTAGILSVVRS